MNRMNDVPPCTKTSGSIEDEFIRKILSVELKKLKVCYSLTGFDEEKGCYEFKNRYYNKKVKVYKQRPEGNGSVVEAYPGVGCWINSEEYPGLECVGVALVAAVKGLEKTNEDVPGLNEWIDWKPGDNQSSSKEIKEIYKKWLENHWYIPNCD